MHPKKNSLMLLEFMNQYMLLILSKSLKINWNLIRGRLKENQQKWNTLRARSIIMAIMNLLKMLSKAQVKTEIDIITKNQHITYCQNKEQQIIMKKYFFYHINMRGIFICNFLQYKYFFSI